MNRFRLSWARKCGERKAKEQGFDDFPIDPFVIAKGEDIEVIPKESDHVGVSGGIIFGDNTGIFYATNIKSQGFQRFTVAHELGHYFLDGHPEEILKMAPVHVSRAGFTQGANSIELEADHFASGLLLPTGLVRKALDRERVGLEGIEVLADMSKCSLTASAIRAAECGAYPMAIVTSQGDHVCYAFMSDGFKKLGKLTALRKGDLLPDTLTASFNRQPDKIKHSERACDTATLNDWFDGPREVELDEQVLGLGSYGYTLTVLSGENLPVDEEDERDDEARLIESYTPRFAYGR